MIGGDDNPKRKLLPMTLIRDFKTFWIEWPKFQMAG